MMFPSRESIAENASPNTPNSLSDCSATDQKNFQKSEKQEDHKPKRLVHIGRRTVQRALLNRPLRLHHVCNFMNLVGLNEETLRNSEAEESYFKTIFYVKSVERIETRKNVIIFHLSNIMKEHPPIEYVMERFNSFGDANFHRIAERIKEAYTAANVIDQRKKRQLMVENNRPLSKYLDSLSGQMFMCKVSPNRLVISRQLMEFLGYDVEDFIIETVKFKTVLNEIVSGERYCEVISKSLENITHVAQLLSNAISLQEFAAATTFVYNDYLITRNNQRVYCEITMNMPNHLQACCRVSKVKAYEEHRQIQLDSRPLQKQLKVECDAIRDKEVDLLRRLIKIPKNMLPQNEQRVSQYQDISLNQS